MTAMKASPAANVAPQKKSRHKGPDREDSEFRSRPPRKDMDDDDDDFDFDDEDVDDDIDPISPMTTTSRTWTTTSISKTTTTSELAPWHGTPVPSAALDPAADFGKARFAVLPLPYDGTSTWLKGADRWPEAILDASANMELYDIETRSEPWRQGIVTMAPVDGMLHPRGHGRRNPSRRPRSDRRRARLVVGLGGEHSVSIGLIRAQAERHPGLTVLQLDAHADTRDPTKARPSTTPASWPAPRRSADFVQVGIRSMDASEMELCRPDRVFFAHELDEAGAWIPEVVARLDDPVYVTIDLDVLDPSEMPSTGTPEPGGLRYRQITRLCWTPSAVPARWWASTSWNCCPTRTTRPRISWRPGSSTR